MQHRQDACGYELDSFRCPDYFTGLFAKLSGIATNLVALKTGKLPAFLFERSRSSSRYAATGLWRPRRRYRL